MFSSLQKAKRKETTRTPICIPFESKYSFDEIKDYLENHLVSELKVSLPLLNKKEKRNLLFLHHSLFELKEEEEEYDSLRAQHEKSPRVLQE